MVFRTGQCNIGPGAIFIQDNVLRSNYAAGRNAFRVSAMLRVAGSGMRMLVGAIFCLDFSNAIAQTVPDFIPDQQNSEQPLPSLMDAAYLPIERDIIAGNLEGARAALVPLLTAEPRSLQGRFLLAEIERRSGSLEAAIEIYRDILAMDPTLDRVRLELAVTLLAANMDDNAKAELFRVLRNAPPGVVASRIRNVLGVIELRKSFIWDAGVSIVGDSNVNAAPHDRTVTVFGLPFELSDESREHSGFGLSAAVAAEWRPQLASGLRARFGISFYAVDYQGARYDFDGANTQLGLQLLRERWTASLLFVGGAQGYGADPYSRSYGFHTDGSWSPAARIAINLSGDFQYASYSDYGLVSGNQWNLGVTPAFALRPDIAAWLNLSYGERDSRSSVFAYESKRLGLGSRIDTNWGMTLLVEADAILYDYRAQNPFFGVTQHDTLAWGYVALAAPRFSVLSLIPRITLSYSNNFSNVAVYRYERTNVEFAFVRRY